MSTNDGRSTMQCYEDSFSVFLDNRHDKSSQLSLLVPNHYDEQDRTVHVQLTSVCRVHSNVYGLGNIHWIRYVTAIDPILSTSFALHKDHHLTSGSVKVPVCTFSTSINPSPIWEKPVTHVSPHSTSVRTLATSS